MRGGRRDNSLWIQAQVLFEVRGPGGRAVRSVRLRRPYGLVGRVVGADVSISDTAVAARHAYIHVDDRGVCLVDLASRTGTRVNGVSVDCAWLGIGDVVEIAGREIELREVRIDGVPILHPPCRDRILSDADERFLSNLSLEPHHRRESRWVVGSELIFLGRDSSSELRPGGQAGGKLHCALLRSSTCAYVVDLQAQDARVNDRPVRGASRIVDGDVVAIGHDRLTVHIEPYSGEHPSVSPRARVLPTPSGVGLARIAPAPPSSADLPVPVSAEPGQDPRDAALAWMLGAMQAGHGELIRRQNELRDALGEALRKVQAESSSVLDSHLERIETLNDELEKLRRHIELNEASTRSAAPAAVPPPTSAPPPPASSPPRPAPALPVPAPLPVQAPPELVGPPAPVSERSRETATWLLKRIDDVEKERRFSLRNLFKFGLFRRREPWLDDFDQVNADTEPFEPDGEEGPISPA